AGRRERRLEVGDVELELRLAGVADGRDAHRLPDRRARRARHAARALAGIELGVELGEARPVRAAGERVLPGLDRPALEAREPLERVLRPADRLAELAVARDVDADGFLPLHHIENRIPEAARIRVAVVRQAALLLRDELEELRRPDQAADVRGQDAGFAASHGAPS